MSVGRAVGRGGDSGNGLGEGGNGFGEGGNWFLMRIQGLVY